MSSTSYDAASDPRDRVNERFAQLGSVRAIDLAAVELDYEGFRALARNPHLSANERIGFPDSYRAGFDGAILRDIVAKLPALAGEEATVVDIGPGCASLPRALIELCRERRHRLVLIDSEEMLAQLPDVPGVTRKVGGPFPGCWREVDVAAGADAILCYSVFHYVYADGNPFEFLDRLIGLLGADGRALIGDIPNTSKRRRFFATEAGRAFHRAFTGDENAPPLTYDEPIPGKIDDAVLLGLMQRAQSAGADAYLLPQPPDLPMANRRDDLLVARA